MSLTRQNIYLSKITNYVAKYGGEVIIDTNEVEVSVNFSGSGILIYKWTNKTNVKNLEKAVLLCILEYYHKIYNPTKDLTDTKISTLMPLTNDQKPLFPKTEGVEPLPTQVVSVLLDQLEQYRSLLIKPRLKKKNQHNGGKKKSVRKHKGIYQSGPKAGKLKPGYKYSGKKTKTGLKIIVKV